ncbi:MAG: DUF2948 family protein [Hyphomicrobiaceae bacterium]|nr:DUF2948 family protein [Hyphomicrobiaceae bacterium]
MDQLKLIAFDAEDLSVVSAHLQDAVTRVGDMTYLPRERRFAALLNRFDWAQAHASGDKMALRRQSALRFERVLSARSTGLDLARKDEVLALLAVAFAPSEPEDPSGTVTLTFAGSAAVQLDVECLEAELRDLGPVWEARSRPDHPLKEGSGPTGR